VTDPALTGMLELIAAHEARACGAILGQARKEAQRLIREAHRDVRTRMHQTLLDLRNQMRHEIAQADAALETARRQHRARCEFALLKWAEKPLREAFIARWQDARARGAWVNQLVIQARRVLPAVSWEVLHAPGWPAAEHEQLAAELTRDLGHAPIFVERTDIEAGLRLCAKGACLDGTLAGLLADRDTVHGRLLADLEP